MRLLLAALFVILVMFGYTCAIGAIYPDGEWPRCAGPSFAFAFFGAIFASQFIFNRSSSRLGQAKSFDDQVAQLKEKGLLISENFRARRAFQVEEFDDEGSHYFVELEDGSVLYLNGQCLYEYEPITDDPELNQSRRFPCSLFTVRRHKNNGCLIDIVCSGEVLEPECIAPHFDKSDVKRGLIPEDGQIFQDKTYEQLKCERLRK